MTEIVNCDNDCQMSAMIEIMLIQQFKRHVAEQRRSVDEAYLPSSLSSGLHYCYMHRHCCMHRHVYRYTAAETHAQNDIRRFFKSNSIHNDRNCKL